MNLRRPLLALLPLLLLIASGIRAGEVASANLNIIGVTLETQANVSTGIDIPAVIQTTFAGKQNDAVPPTDMLVTGDLTGPGLDQPIAVTTQPGGKFTLPPLHEKGDYTLANIRLLDASGKFVQGAIPSFTVVHVVGTLDTNVTVRQLTPDDLRARGINIDARNYDVYDYNFVFAINGQTVQVPYSVVLDKRTHELTPVPGANSYSLPVPKIGYTPPRFQPPAIFTTVLEEITSDKSPEEGSGDEHEPKKRGRTIPAAIVIPTGFGVLHQFFAVILNVTNASPADSQIVLDAVTATISTPTGLRVVKVNPSVTIGQPVPVTNPATGETFLIAQAQGNVDWSLEALRTGTHTVAIDVRATYKAPNQADVALHGQVSSSIVVSDPRFQINFVHPDNVRKQEPYTAYAFITNTSPQAQTVKIDLSTIPPCGGGFNNHLCRTEGGTGIVDKTFQPGQTIPIPYKLTPDITGHVYAAAGDSPEGISTSVSLTMGVSASGIPLSPATLLMPHYAQYVSPSLVEGMMPLLGLGYSLATAPQIPQLSTFPHLIRNDVFTRAQDIARAGQRIFTARHAVATDDVAEDRDPIFALSLDLLGNVERLDLTADMHEWDQLRMMEVNGRTAGAAMARELERVGLANGKSMKSFVDDFATATSHRTPFVLALAHGPLVNGNARPYAMTVTAADTKTSMVLPAETAGATRTLPWGELTKFNSATETGELALVGRWRENLELSIVPAATSFTLELIYPGATNGTSLRTSIDITGATSGSPVKVVIARGNKTLIVTGATAVPLVNDVAQTPLALAGAAQDLHLDGAGHIVTLLFNRPLNVADPTTLRNLFELTTSVPSANYTVKRKNNPAEPKLPVIPGAALQDDGRMITISFDHALSTHATYSIAIDPLLDAISGTYSTTGIAPRIDNDAPGGVVVGKLLLGDNTPVANNFVELDDALGAQYDTTLADGSFLFEFIARDIDAGIAGNYSVSSIVGTKEARLAGAIRVNGEVQRIVLQLLGRGSAKGHVSYSDGTAIAKAPVTIANPLFGDSQRVMTDSNGNYTAADLAIGPLTFAVQDLDGNVAYASTQIKTPGEQITQDLVIQKRELNGLGTVRVTVRRSDQKDAAGNLLPVAGAHVGVFAQGYTLVDAYTDANGQYEFRDIPAGLISVIAAEFTITRESAGEEHDLKRDTTLETTLVLHVPTPTETAGYATIEGDVKRDDPTTPGDRSRDVLVPGAIVSLSGMSSVTADSNGHYIITNVPTTLAAARVSIFDPATNRQGRATAPTPLQAGKVNILPLLLSTSQPQGFATFRVRLFSVSGDKVTRYRVIWPGYPPNPFTQVSPGVYELANIKVPQTAEIWAVPTGRDAIYGDQVAHGTITASFDGQTPVLDLRLPGQGTVRARVLVRERCPDTNPTCTPGYGVGAAKIGVSYQMWDDTNQAMMAQERPGIETEPVSGYAIIPNVPVGNANIETIDHPSGYASAEKYVAFEGDTQSVDLVLASLGNITGRVVNYDGQTPVGGATVNFSGGTAHVDGLTTKADGSFVVPAMAGGQGFTITAEATIDGIYRVGYVTGQTPSGGGPVTGLVIVMRTQANVDGKIVDETGAILPLARYWARELSWPYRSFGSEHDPLYAGADGRFVLNNVFSGGVRITAEHPTFQERRGDAQVTIGFEGDNKPGVEVKVSAAAGTSSLSVTVVDSNNAYAHVPNAEVTIIRNGKTFDFGTTDANGVVNFEQLPAGESYDVLATSKSLGRSGATRAVALVRDVPATAQVALTLTGRVSGKLVDGDVDPPPVVKGAPVYLRNDTIQTIASTDGTGSFLFNGIPEGTFRLEAIDLDSGRRAVNETPLFIDKLFPDRENITLSLEKTAALNVGVYLPDDHGASSGVLAPLVDVTVKQGNYYSRELQAAGERITFPKMFSDADYRIDVIELGGLERKVSKTGHINKGTYQASDSLVFSTTGSVRVEVTADDPTLLPGAHLTVSGNGKSANLFLDATGVVELDGFQLGNVSAQVTSSSLSASASGNLVSHSTKLVLPMKLGSLAAIGGYVDAEASGVSAGTRVVANVSSSSGGLTLETRTDAAGHYLFNGIPVASTTVNLTFYGPDDVTPGASLSNVSIPAGSTGTIAMARVRLDATRPTTIAIFPSNNANSVSPNSHILVTFSEPLNLATVNGGNFQLISTDDGRTADTSMIAEVVNGAWRVNITPTSLLKSNTIYRFVIGTGVTDLSNLHLGATITTSFTTVDYTEPKITGISPSTAIPIENGVTFRLKFNKPIDLTSFNAGQGGVAVLEKLDGPAGAVSANVPVALNLDRLDASTLLLAPAGVEIASSSYYRITVSGARDTVQPPNVMKAPQSFSYSSVDTVRPVAAIVSPVADATPLVGGASYVVKVRITDFGTNTPSKDIQYVDWFTTDGTTDTAVSRTRIAPDYGYLFVVPAGVTKLTLKASATDLSFNSSEVVSFTWDVVANKPPQDVTLTTSAPSSYIARSFDANVTFTDEGTLATVSIAATGQHADGSSYVLPATQFTPALNQQVSRANTTAPWSPSPAKFTIKLPSDLKEGVPLQLAVTVKDSDQQPATVTSSIDVLVDSVAPVAVSLDPKPETRYKYVTGAANTFPITLKVKDAESGVVRAHVSYDGNDVDLTNGTYDAATATWTFTTTGHVVAKNTDTRVHIVATAFDYHGNSTPSTVDVIFDSVNDGTFPVAQWLSPLDGAALPATLPSAQAVTATLRLHATDDVHVEKVVFSSPDFVTPPAPLTAPTRTGDIYEQVVTFKPLTAGTPVVINATISDSDTQHDVTLPISIDPVAIDVAAGDAIITGDAAITASSAAQYANRTIVAMGSGTDLYIKVPLTLANLIVLNGAHVGNPDRVKLDLTIKDHLFVDADSSIDVSAKGYLGGHQVSEDGTFTNSSALGMTVGNTLMAVPMAGSYGGAGTVDPGNETTTATYGSIDVPSEFGSGGYGQLNGSVKGGNGGGAIALHGGAAQTDLSRFVVAGVIRADGETGVSQWAPGSGGSVLLDARALVTGPSSRITANGGDDDAANNEQRGAGGGRISATIAERFDVSSLSLLLQARGGRNATGSEGRTYVDGGAGTILLRRPGSTGPELIVSSFDERNPSSTHLTRPTPISSANGSLTFSAITAGPRALVRFDDGYTVADPLNVKVDATATVLLPADLPAITMTTTPANGANVIQNTNVVAALGATAKAGVGRITFAYTAGTTSPVQFFDYASTIPATNPTILVSPTATPGNATLKAIVVDRAGRTAETAVSAFNVVENVAANITQFDVTPATEVFAGHTIAVAAAATDDVAVTSLTLAATNGFSVTSQNPVVNGLSTSRTFSVAVPAAATSGTKIDLTLTAADNFPGRAATSQLKSVTVAADPNPPSITVSSPTTNQTFLVSSSTTIPVRAVITDAEVAVDPTKVFVSLGGAAPVAMVVDPSVTNGYKADLPIPPVDGSDPVAKTVVVTARDYQGNLATAPAISINIQPVFDPNGPVVSWLCPSVGAGAMFPAGYTTTVRAKATGASADNGITTVQFYVGESATPVSASLVNGAYQASITMPSGADGDSVVLRVVATSIRNNTTTVTNSITLVSGTTISADKNIITGDTTYENQTVIITGTTKVTIDGPHTFARLLVLDNATVTHSPVASGGAAGLSLTVTGATYVSCNGAIDVTSKGYAPNRTYPGATASTAQSGGAHIGSAFGYNGIAGTTFGSVYRPQEAGAGAGDIVSGGGIVHLTAARVANDGAIRANGEANQSRSAAGGSVWINATDLGGNGVIEARGPDGGYPGGGGGAIALEYTGTTSGTLLSSGLNVRGGPNGSLTGGAGSIYMKTASSTYGDVIFDNRTTGAAGTSLPSLGNGTAVTGSTGVTLVTDRTVDIPAYFIGHWVEISNAAGAPKGTWRIASVSAKTATLVANGTETVNVQPGDKWQGVYRFDTMRTINGESVTSIDPIRLGVNGVINLQGPTAGGQYLEILNPIVGTTVTVTGNVSVPSITATTLTVKTGATLSAPRNNTTPITLQLNISGNLTIETGASLDVTARGYAQNRTYPGATASTGQTGGVHIGSAVGFNGNPGSTFGSVYRPQEAGGGAGDLGTGGGVIRIMTGTFTNNGAVRANGEANQSRSGAGGSVWITATDVAGNGIIEARGPDPGYTGGGGGAITVEYSGTASGTMLTSGFNARGGPGGNGTGGAGSVYLRSGSSTYGDVIFDNKTTGGAGTPLPSLGGGTTVAGSTGATLVTDRTVDIPAYFIGHWVEISNAAGTLKGTWRIASVNAKTATLVANGSETVDVQPGDKWQGVYRFDTMRTINGEAVTSVDPIRIGIDGVINLQGPTTGGQYLELFNPITGTTVTITGNVSVPSITATTLTVKTGATLTAPRNNTTPNTLQLNISGALTIETGASLDVTARGYAQNRTYPGATASTGQTGGVHIGSAVGYNGNPGSTFGSVYRPQEPGAGAGDLGTGGGVIRITTGTFTNNGAVRANGEANQSRSGAGGSVWITATDVAGNGIIEARGPDPGYTGGGGGAITVEYSGSASGTMLTTGLNARGGPGGNGTGGAGSVYLRSASSTYGDVIFDNKTTGGAGTSLPSLGNGTAVTGSTGVTLVTDRTVNVPAYFIGHWVEISNAAGTLKGTWRIASVNAKTATLVANGSETIDVQPGDKWQGVYRFDTMRTINGEAITSPDPIRIGIDGVINLQGPTTGGQYLELFNPIAGNTVTVTGNVSVPSIIATTLTVKTGATLTAPRNNTTPNTLQLNISGALTIETGASLDVTARGYAQNRTYPGATASTGQTGGVHIGSAIGYNGNPGSTFGSVYRPQEPGGGAGDLGTGGGVIRITTGTFTNNGAVRANGEANQSRSGAGGSVWITATDVAGNGIIEARGPDPGYTGGGGGAITVEYSGTATGTMLTTGFNARGGPGGNGTGGAGSVYLKSGSSTYGDVIFDNKTTGGAGTPLPSLGGGTAQSGSSGATLISDRTVDVPQYFVGHWIEISTAAGVLKGTWRIASASAKTVILAPNGSETIDVQPGDKWQGVYRFDTMRTVNGESVTSVDPIRIGVDGVVNLQGPTAANQYLEFFNPIAGTTVTITGNVSVPAITATTLTVKTGATLTTPRNNTTPNALQLNVSGALTIEAGASLDVTARGYGANRTYPNATPSTGQTGGVHIGSAFGYNGSPGTTFGSICRPQEAGAGAGDFASGGGAIRITAGTFTNNGAVRANGEANQSRSGAGGSVWITATDVAGTGIIEARGPDPGYTGGGGGAISVEYTGTSTGTMLAAGLNARGGPGGNGTGGAGSIYVKSPSSIYGSVTFDNKVAGGAVTDLPSLGMGSALTGSTGSTLVTDRAVAIPAYFIGHWINVTDATGTLKGSWRIGTVNNKTVTLVPNGNETISIDAGDFWRGSYKFDSITLRTVNVQTSELVEAPAPDSVSSTYAFGNPAAPKVDATKFSFTSGGAGPALVAAAGAVTDPDGSLIVTITNVRTAATWSVTISNGAAFTIGIAGNQGDTIKVRAKDSHKYPLESLDVVVGTLPSGSPEVTQVPRATLSSDTNFRARLLAFDGITLAVAGNGDKVALLNVADPLHPTVTRTIAFNNGTISHVAIANRTLYVAANDLATLDLDDANSSPIYTPDAGNFETTVSVDGGYAFTTTPHNGDGRLRIYDVSVRGGVPRVAAEYGWSGSTGSVLFRDVNFYSHYVVLTTPDTANSRGHDVVVIDRSDINGMTFVADLDVPNFAASRGTIVGSNLYLVGSGSNELVVVSLANPAAPVVAGRTPLLAAATGIAVNATDAIVADQATGVVDVNITNSAQPSVAGSVGTSGAAWDVVLAPPYAFVANDSGISIIPMALPPSIDTTKISMSLSGATVTITGTAKAVLGAAPLSLTFLNTVVAGATPVTTTAAADGSFSVTVAAAAGDPFTLQVTDSASRVTGPLSIGRAPFGASVRTQTLSASVTGDASFRARLVATEGNRMVVTSWSGSGRALIYDTTSPGSPAFMRSVALAGVIRDVSIRNGWAIFASNDLILLNLADSASTPITLPDAGNIETGLVISGNYVFTSTPHNGDARIRIYDISSPTAAHVVLDQGFSGNVGSINFRGFALLGDNYLVAFSSDSANSRGHDVVVLDRRDVNALKVVADLDIPNFDAFRGRISGTTLYLAGYYGAAVVNLAVPSSPTYTKLPVSGTPLGVDVSGATLAFGDGAAGVTMFDITTPLTPRALGTQAIGGMTWGVAFNRGQLYAANEQGIVTLRDIATGPTITQSLISVTGDTVSLANVAIGADSVSGVAPINIEVKDSTTGASVTRQYLAAGMSISLPASPGDTVTVKVTDALGHTAGPIAVGVVPFGSAVKTVPITVAQTDGAFRARLLATDGNKLVVTSWTPTNLNNSGAIVIYDITTPDNPVVWRQLSVSGNIRGVTTTNGYAVVASNDLVLVSLTDPNASPIYIPDVGNIETSVAVSGVYAFTVTPHNGDARVRVYDISDRVNAHWIRDQGFSGVVGSINFRGLTTYGDNYLIAFSSDVANSRGHDIVIIDRRDVNNMSVVRDVDVPNFEGFHGKVVGTTLYAAGYFSAVSLDLANMATATPKTLATPGHPLGVDGSGPTLAIGDGANGVAFYDITAPATPRYLGEQATGGFAWDVAFNRGALYVANESGLSVITNVGSAPLIRPELITITSDGSGSAQLFGAANAITGQPSLTMTISNASRSVTATSSTIASDGSFNTATLSAMPGDAILITVTDGGNRSSSAIVGKVPFGTALTIPITVAQTNTAYRAELMAVGDGKLVVVGATTDSRVVIYDVSNPAVPVLWRSVAVAGTVRDVSVTPGYAVIGSNDLILVSLTDPNATPIQMRDIGNFEDAVFVSGNYAFTATPHNGDARIRIYDISDPQSPRWVRDQGLAGSVGSLRFRGFTGYGDDYLIAYTEQTANSREHDVVVIDRRDINNLFVVSDTAIGGFSAWRGTVVGTTLYAVGYTGGVAVVDLRNLASPTYTLVAANGTPLGVGASGSTLAVGDGTGVTFYDTSNALAPAMLGSQTTGGLARDVLFYRGQLYVANETGIVVLQNVVAAPTVDANRITVTTDGATIASTAGATGAVTGLGPITASISNAGGTAGGLAIAADGSFSAASLAAAPGTKLTFSTTGRGNRSGALTFAVPFAASRFVVPAGQAQSNEEAYRSRRIAMSGNWLVVASRPDFPSGRMLIYDLNNINTAPRVFVANGAVSDFTVANNTLYFVANDFGTLDLTNPLSTVNYAADRGNVETAIALQGTYVFNSTPHNGDGRIRVYDVTTPSAPVWVGDSGTLGSVLHRKIIPFGTTYLVTLTTDTVSGRERDVVILNRTNPAAVTFVADLPIPNFLPVDAILSGNTLYVTGGDAGLAIVDLTNPAAPALISVTNTPGVARGLVLTAANELAVADGSGEGITFIDVTDKQHPVIKGSQLLPGNTADLKAIGKTLYTASDNVINVVTRP